jgi:H+-transporting ATPase
MAERRISYAPDVENGQNARSSGDVIDGQPLDEYSALNRYISTARDRRRGSTSSAGALEAGEKKKGWQFWKKSGTGEATDDQFIAPEEWLETDIRAGLNSSDIDGRRRKTGWNELVTEKTNLFVQFIGYFRGPILYGKLSIGTFFFDASQHPWFALATRILSLTMVTRHSYGIGRSFGCRSP